MWFTYILLSIKDNRTYTGSTNNLKNRLNEHNKGLVTATKNRLPLKCIYYEKFDNEKEARKRERYFISCVGRKFIKVKIFKK